MLEPLLSHLPYIDHTVKKGEGGCEKTGTRLTYEGPQSAERHWEPIHTWATQSKQSMCKGLREELGALKVIYKGAQLMCPVLWSSSCLPSSLVRFQPQESPFPFFPQTVFVSIAILIPLSNALF